MKNHFPQTILTFIVTTFVTGTLSVLFFIASSFQSAVRNYALEQTGNYHYQYYTDAGTSTAKLLEEMAEQFQTDNWFSNVEYADDGNTATLTLTVAHPGLFTTRTMKEKFNTLENLYLFYSACFYGAPSAYFHCSSPDTRCSVLRFFHAKGTGICNASFYRNDKRTAP
jgi:hypothetical protein